MVALSPYQNVQQLGDRTKNRRVDMSAGLSQFFISKVIGTGSFASVKQVVHRVSGDVYALKAVKKRKVFSSGGTAEHIAREAEVQLRLRHPNIVQLYCHFEDSRHVYLLLEHVSGGQLLDRMKNTRVLPNREAAQFFSDIATGLIYLHSHGVVHRDIKPENVLLQPAGGQTLIAKLADFGCCATVTTSNPTRETICGTMDYLAPEMINSEPHDHNVDVWAAGVLLYEMIVGATPFGGASKLDVFRRIMTVDLSVPRGTDEAAKDLIQKLLIFKREDRLLLEDAVQHSFVVMNTSPTPVEASDLLVDSATSHPPCPPCSDKRPAQRNCGSILPIKLSRFESDGVKVSAFSLASTTTSRPGCSTSPSFSGVSFSTASHEDWHSSLGQLGVQRRLCRLRSLTPEREDNVSKVDDELGHVDKVLRSSIEQEEDADLPGLVPLIRRAESNKFGSKSGPTASLAVCTRERAKPKAAARRKDKRVCVGTIFPPAGA